MRSRPLILIALIALTACVGGTPVVNPFTTGAAVAVGAYENSQKREKWQEYALKGDVYAQFELAKSYHSNKLEGALDGRYALRWYCEAAKNGDAKAQYLLGQVHEGQLTLPGVTVPHNDAYAFMWYTLAARRQHKDAAKRMGMLDNILTSEQRRDALRTIPSVESVDCTGWLKLPIAKSNANDQQPEKKAP